MNELFSQILAVIITIYASVLGLWNDNIEVTDNAASLSGLTITTQEQSLDSSTDYVSLRETLNKALERISYIVKTSTSSIETNEEETNDDSSTNKLEDAIVNIYCTQKTKDYKRTTSGTGFFIGDKGVILTNAHVGQFLLLENTNEFGDTDCFVRSGKEAKNTYEVSLLYVSPTWILDNSDIISSLKPQGTGENDFALLFVTSTLNDLPLPDVFPHLPPATNPLTKDYEGQPVVLVGYPSAEKISGERIVATTTITNLYTFESGYADIFSVSASPLGHQGASGGPVIDSLGRAIGVITTRDNGTTILNAITLSHIDRQIKHETGYDLTSIIKSDVAKRSEIFNKTLFPILQSVLTNKL